MTNKEDKSINLIEKTKIEELKLDESPKSIGDIINLTSKHDHDIRKLNKNIKVLIWVWVTISSLLLFNLIYWIYESYFHTNQIQYSFEIAKNNFENEIKDFKKEIENLKEDNQKLKENIKNEIEKDIYKTILQKN